MEKQFRVLNYSCSESKKGVIIHNRVFFVTDGGLQLTIRPQLTPVYVAVTIIREKITSCSQIRTSREMLSNTRSLLHAAIFLGNACISHYRWRWNILLASFPNFMVLRQNVCLHTFVHKESKLYMINILSVLNAYN